MNNLRDNDDPLSSVRHDHDRIRLKYLVDVNPDSVTGQFSDSDEIEYVEISSVNARGEITDTQMVEFGEAPSRAQRLVQPGDVLISTVRTYLKAIAQIQSPPENMVVSSGFGVLRPNERINPDYLWYVLQSTPFIDWVVANSEGVSYPAISTGRLSDMVIPVPSITQQERICAYLDPWLDSIEQNVGRLNGYKKDLLNQKDHLQRELILGAESPCETSVDSGVDWIGEVPKHWDIVRTRFVAELESGHTPDRSNDEYWENTDIPWVTTSDIKPFREGRKRYLYETEYQISEFGMENSGAHLLPEGTVFLSRTASVGFSGIMGEPMATSQDFANWVCGDEIIPEYLLYVFRSMDQEFDRLMQGSTHQTIYMPDIKSFKTPLPPLEEQREIVNHIEAETERLWELIDRVEETIDLLEEKRQALITAAVTGQIDVSEVKMAPKASFT
ncbi:restriction endonuclease S subunit [Halovivax ruber XH-70]|uniref:Restriction endonuclease S subunit n=1 Tax=Halovivax ruber (strain DSM 18193 / JCM 13892 / XH-70) TaxID=797302 RepID=L0IHD7_HALRX|nr:restriction endonuclease subunit S [Halovivax ruber]AGB17377.1 restriction endonuclease S subunit [Halovivax ruber XH-70]